MKILKGKLVIYYFYHGYLFWIKQRKFFILLTYIYVEFKLQSYTKLGIVCSCLCEVDFSYSNWIEHKCSLQIYTLFAKCVVRMNAVQIWRKIQIEFAKKKHPFRTDRVISKMVIDPFFYCMMHTAAHAQLYITFSKAFLSWNN